ncbi:transcription initiation factor TFIIIB, partial [Toxoplasma gondii MAS]
KTTAEHGTTESLRKRRGKRACCL